MIRSHSGHRSTVNFQRCHLWQELIWDHHRAQPLAKECLKLEKHFRKIVSTYCQRMLKCCCFWSITWEPLTIQLHCQLFLKVSLSQLYRNWCRQTRHRQCRHWFWPFRWCVIIVHKFYNFYYQVKFLFQRNYIEGNGISLLYEWLHLQLQCWKKYLFL